MVAGHAKAVRFMVVRRLHERALLLVSAASLQVALCFALPSLSPISPVSIDHQLAAGQFAAPDPDPASNPDVPADPDAEPSDSGGERSDSDDDDSKSSPERFSVPVPPLVSAPRIETEDSPIPGPHREPLPRPPRV